MRKIFFLIAIVAFYSGELKAQSRHLYDLYFLEESGLDTIKLSDFKGKKILIANTASLSKSVDQLASLKKLSKQFQDSNLVVIVCPSNSFGNEPGSNLEIRFFLENRFSLELPVAAKLDVLGSGSHPFYQWFSDKNSNGLVNGKVKSDFTKILIGENGEIIGIFSEQIDPLDPVVLTAIRRK